MQNIDSPPTENRYLQAAEFLADSLSRYQNPILKIKFFSRPEEPLKNIT
jgi:hypothetical protein